MRILLVEDDKNVLRQLSACLKEHGYVVDVAEDGEEGYFLGETEPYDAVILDLGLPQMDGLSVLRRWRLEKRTMPVLILTARGDWSEKVAGFDAGCDDYVAKPFQMEELLARLRALIRRASGHASPDLTCGSLRLDSRMGRIFLEDKMLSLTAHEYKILSYFMHHKGKVISRSELIDHIYDQNFDLDSNTIEVFIGRLRKKLGRRYIKTERGLGYCLSDDGARRG
ncbi:MAG: response regulator transcription factor [Alphaproteobacteria bacterium GM7ARS4]|nr:response regulator transcription factor [Alphaproteobacteria bacterium GM7ARS4]